MSLHSIQVFEPERRRLCVGYMPLLDSAPLLWAAHRGYFVAQGLEVQLACEVSWASLRDRLAYGALDAAQCLAPMPVAATLGSDGVGVPLLTGLCLSQGGSAITFARRMVQRIGIRPGMSVSESACAVAAYLDDGERLRLAHVFPFSMHHYLLRDWLAMGNVDMERARLEFRVAPPPQMVRLLESGQVDGFCVGEPWNTAAVRGDLGVVVLPTSAIWDGGAEKVLGVRRDWARDYPNTHRALLAAVLTALEELNSRDCYAELSALLVHHGVLSVPREWVEAALRGEGAGAAPRFTAGLRAFPRRSQMMWCALQMLRWQQCQPPISLAALTAAVCDGAAFNDAAAALGMAQPAVDAVREGAGHAVLGLDGATVPTRFSRGSELDPDNPAEYLVARGWAAADAHAALAG